MQQKTNQILYAYWNDVRAGRFAPRRFDIEPARIAGILAETFILERAAADTYRFRLAGTRICEIFGFELRGQDFFDGWNATDRAGLADSIARITRDGGVGALTFTAATADGRTVALEAIVLPLVHTHDQVDRLLGAISPIEQPTWLGTERLLERRMTHNHVFWPDGRPHAALGSGDRQAPFLPSVRGARLVRADRRQFRVYEGGRNGDG